jgi:hypothetical protein
MTRTRRVLIAGGGLIMAYAVVGALADADVKPLGLLAFLVAVLVGHDGVLLPLVIGAGALIGRFVPAGDRVTVRVAALCSVAVAVVALPLVLGYGRTTDNPSALPLPYGRGLATVLAVIWTAALTAILVRRIHQRAGRRGRRVHRADDVAGPAYGRQVAGARLPTRPRRR